MIFAQTLGLLAFLGMFAIILAFRGRARWPLPSDFFLAFMALMWSPLAFFPLSATHLSSVQLAEPYQWIFTFTYATMCVVLGIGFVAARAMTSRGQTLKPARELSDKEQLRFQRLSLVSAVALVMLYLASGEVRAHLSDLAGYLSSTSILSYTELRRDVVRSGFVMGELHSRLQYSVVAFLFCALIVGGLRSKSPKAFLWFAIAVTLFIVCAATLRKRPYLYFFVLAAGTTILFAAYRGVKRKTIYGWGALSVGACFGLMLILYSVQYRDNHEKDLSANLNTLAFRTFAAYPAGYKLYVDLYPDRVPFTIGRSIGLLQPLIGAVDQPYEVVPSYYGEDKTTFPSGFISYAYSDFGYVGVVVFSFLAGALIGALNAFVLRRDTVNFRLVGTVTLGLGTAYLCNKSFSAALLSGGLLLIPICILVFERVVVRSSKAR